MNVRTSNEILAILSSDKNTCLCAQVAVGFKIFSPFPLLKCVLCHLLVENL